MLLIVGAIVVLGAVIGGFVFEGGHVLALNQPAEYIIIGGSAIGTLIMATPVHVLKKLVGQAMGLLKSALSKDDYLDLLSLLNKLFKQVQQGECSSWNLTSRSPLRVRSCQSIRSSWRTTTPSTFSVIR